MPNPSLTPAELAALAAQVTTPASEASTAAAGAGATNEPVVPPAATQVTESQAGQVDASLQARLDVLTSQVKEKDTALIQAGVELAQAKAALAPLEASVAAEKATSQALAAIVATSVTNMRVALGQSAAGVAALSPDQLLADHKALVPTFMDKFKANGVAAVSATETTEPVAEVSDLHLARVNATRINRNK